MMPIRIQRKRTKGWCMPENTVYVGRGSKWGNPVKVGDDLSYHFPGVTLATNTDCVRAYRTLCEANVAIHKNWYKTLRGKNLACWCGPDDDCHADVLLELANKGEAA